MAEPLRHRQTKEAATDMFSLQPPRDISTLHCAGPREEPRPARRQRDRNQLFAVEIEAKRLDLMRELLPKAARIAVLINPANVRNTEAHLEIAASSGSSIS